MYKKFLEQFQKECPDRKVIFLCTAGSHFFGLNGPNSDWDFKGIYLPSPQEIYNGESKRKMVELKTNPGNKLNIKNNNTDVDFTLVSITKFLDLLSRGDFNFIELLHTPKDKIIIDSEIMKNLRSIRTSLIVNDISSFLGFIKKEIMRYGTNVNHYGVQERLLKFLEKYHSHTVLKDVWADIEEFAKNESMVSITESETGHHEMIPSLKIAQRLFQNSVSVSYTREQLTEKMARYGHRSKAAVGGEYCLKGIYHAKRLVYEAEDIFNFNELQLPFNKERLEYLRKIKNGLLDKETVFDDINESVEVLFEKEKKVISNKKQVENIINKLILQFEGSKRIEYLLSQQKDIPVEYEKIFQDNFWNLLA